MELFPTISGYFSCKEITDEIHGMLNSEFSEFSHLSNMSNQLPNLMFGQTSASLRQLATRTIFQHCFIKHRNCVAKLLPVDVIKETVSNMDANDIQPYEDYINFILNSTVLQAFVKHLGLPRDFLVNFEVELLLHRIAHKMSVLKAMPPENIFCESDGSLSDLSGSESAYSEEGGDSDLEYWWGVFKVRHAGWIETKSVALSLNNSSLLSRK